MPRFRWSSRARAVAPALQPRARPRVALAQRSHATDAAAQGAGAAPAAAPLTLDLTQVKAAVRDAGAVQANIDARRARGDAASAAAAYTQWVELQQRAAELRAARRRVARRSPGEAPSAESIAEGKRLKAELAALEAQLREAEAAVAAAAALLPNDTHPDAPVGGEEAAVTVKVVGEKPEFDFEPRDHEALGAAGALDLFDMEGGAAVSGARFAVLRNDAVMLELALLQWALAQARAAGFTPLAVPDVARASVVEACGFQPRSGDGEREASQVYSVVDSDLCLVGTAEIGVAGLHAGKVYDYAELPVRNTAHSHCFRREAGSGGAASRGL